MDEVRLICFEGGVYDEWRQRVKDLPIIKIVIADLRNRHVYKLTSDLKINEDKEKMIVYRFQRSEPLPRNL